MSKNVIFCYSGTGNCLDMAKNIARELGDTDIIMMRKAPVKTDVSDAERRPVRPTQKKLSMMFWLLRKQSMDI